MRVFLLVFLVGLLTAPGAVAAAVDGDGGNVEMQALLKDDGTGRLFVNNTDGPWRWESCTPDVTQCSRVAGGRELSTYGVRPPAVFRVSSEGMVGISPEWRGRVEQIAPPSVTGTIRANEFVSPMPGRWARGWETEHSELQLSACSSAGGKGCTTLTHSHYIRQDCSLPALPSASFVIPAEFAGQYLRVAERRMGAGPHIRTLDRANSPYGHPVWRRDGVTSAAIVGRIGSAVKDFPGECGPPVPSEGSISKRGIGFVRCGQKCRATLTASRAGRVVREVRPIGRSRGALFVGPPDLIAVPPSGLAMLGEGAITVALRVDGRLRAKRVIRAGV